MMFSVCASLFLALVTFPLICRAVIPDELHQKFLLYNQYAGASYCKNVNDPFAKPGGRITCKTATCPLVEKNNATVVAAMTEVLFSSIAVIAKDPVEKNLGNHAFGFNPVTC